MKSSSTGNAFQRTVVRAGFFLIGRALQSLSKRDERIREELAAFRSGTRIVLEVGGDKGLCASFRVKDGLLEYLGSKPPVTRELTLVLKNVRSAFMLITTLRSLPATYAEHRIGVGGNVSDSMIFTRCLYIAEAYLFPRFLAKRAMPAVPEMGWRRLGTRLRTYFIAIPFGK